MSAATAPSPARKAISFVHASDLHLETPPHGLAEIPEHLRDNLLEAPYRAAERVFDLALSEKVDFLVLAGDVLAANLTGPRGPCFLVKQLQRLRDRGIAVYWAPGAAEGDPWPAHIELPDNVYRFSPCVREFTHRRGGMAVAQLVHGSGLGSAAEGATPRLIPASSAGLPTIAVAYVDREVAPLAFHSPSVHYWALGGQHHAHTPVDERRVAHFCGSPQGRSPQETGEHGCTLVMVDEEGVVTHRAAATDLFRWRRESLQITPHTTREQLLQDCRDRLSQVVADENDVAHLVCFSVQGDGPLARRLRRENLATELLDELRSDYGYRNPAAWTASLGVEHARPLPEGYREQNFLGDYLRVVQQLQQNAAAAIDLQSYAASDEPHAAAELVQRVRTATGAERERLLEQAACLGIDLLGAQASGASANATPVGR